MLEVKCGWVKGGDPVVNVWRGDVLYGVGFLSSVRRWGFSRLHTPGVRTLRVGCVLFYRVCAREAFTK